MALLVKWTETLDSIFKAQGGGLQRSLFGLSHLSSLRNLQGSSDYPTGQLTTDFLIFI